MTVVVGIAAAPGIARELADELAVALPQELEHDLPDVGWRIDVADLPPHDATVDSHDLVAAVREAMLLRGWDVGIGLIDLPLRAGRRPVSAHASATHGVGLVSLPALGAVRLAHRLRRAVVHLIEGVLGESVGVGRRAGGETARRARLAGRLREIGSPLGHARAHEDGTIRFVGAVLRGNLRLLVGMVRANQPARVITRLSAALVAALGTVAGVLAFSEHWVLANAMSEPRLAVLAVSSVVAACVALVLAHGLWERSGDPLARERVMLFNIATVCTLALGVLALYGALLIVTLGGAVALIPPHLFEEHLGRDAGVAEFLRLAWLGATLGTIGGALGSLVESDLEVRRATYRTRADERTEVPGLRDDVEPAGTR